MKQTGKHRVIVINLLVALALSIPVMIGKWKMNRAYSEDGEEEGC